MHGDRQVSTQKLARLIGARSVEPCSGDGEPPFGGTWWAVPPPFGTRHPMPVYMEESIHGAGRRSTSTGGGKGSSVGFSPREAVRVLSPVLVNVAV